MVQLVKGLDVGTMNLASAILDTAGKVKVRRMRNTFLDIEVNSFTKNMLKKHKVKYAEREGKVYILGESAFELSNIINMLFIGLTKTMSCTLCIFHKI